MNEPTKELERLKDCIRKSRHIVFFGGAGVSTESGIPDFRSVDGLYHQSYRYPPETILSHSFFVSNPEEFFRFYREKMLCLTAKPNITHKTLARLEEEGRLKGIVTQNIDGLHQAAGSRHVIELHGSVHRNYCMRCHKAYDASFMLNTTGVPRCDCGGIIKPDVVLYEESLKEEDIEEAIYLISHTDILIVGGTSLSVYPAASFLQYFQGSRLVLINKTATPYDETADILLQTGLGEVFSQLP